MPLVKDEPHADGKPLAARFLSFYAVEWSVALIVIVTLIITSPTLGETPLNAVLGPVRDIVPIALMLVLVDGVSSRTHLARTLPPWLRHALVVLLAAALTEVFEGLVPIADPDRDRWLAEYLEATSYTAVFWITCRGVRWLLGRRSGPEKPGVPARPAGLLALLEPPLRDDLRWMKAEGNYVDVHGGAGHDLVNYGFARAIDELGEQGLQVHRSYWVALNAIDQLKTEGSRTLIVLKGGQRIPVSRTYAREVRERLS